MKYQFIKIKGYKIRYWKAGTKGKTILLVHGLGASIDRWAFNIEALSKNNTVIALDLLGHGESDKPDCEYTTAMWCEMLKSFIDELKLSKFVLIGHSLGGEVVLNFALKYLNCIEKLILINSLGLENKMPIMYKILGIPILGNLLFNPSPKTSEKVIKSLVYDQSLVTKEIAEMDYQLCLVPGFKKAFLNAIKNMCKAKYYKKIEKNLSKINVPTLIIWGKEDRLLPIRNARLFNKKIKNSTLHIFEKCGHLPQFEHFDEFNKVVSDFCVN